MRAPLKKLICSLVLVVGLVGAAPAQILQSGNVTPGHPLYWVTNGVAGDAGTAANGFLTSLGITAQGPSFCQNSASVTSAGYQQLCFGVTTATGANISLQNFGTAPSGTLTFSVNGIAYPFPGSLSQLTVGTTPVIGGTNGACLYVNVNVVGNQTCSISSISSLTGDVTATGPGVAVATLATVNATVGTFGSSAAVPVVTVNGKGLVTAISNTSIAIPGTQLTGTTLASNIVTSSLTSVGTLASGTWQGSVIGSTYGGTGVNNGSSTLTLGAALVTTGTSAPTLAFPSSTPFTYTFQASSDTIVGRATTDTLTNKTLTSPTINSGTLAAGALSGTFSGTPTFSGANFVTLGNMVQAAAATLIGNPTASLANQSAFTIQSGTDISSPNTTLDWIPIYNHTTGTIEKVNASELTSSVGSGVTSLNGLNGVLTLAQGANVSIASGGTTVTLTAPGSNIAGDARNLKIVQGSTTTLTVTADEITTETTLGGTTYKEASVSHTLTITGTGANGMDTGSTPNGYICVYSITKGDGSTYAVLGQNAATNSCPTIYGGANIPSGYIASGLIGIWPTTSGPTVLAGTIINREFVYNAPCLVASNITGATSLTNQSVSACVPPKAIAVSGLWGSALAHVNVGAVASNTAGTGAQSAQMGASAATQSTLGGIVSTGSYMSFRLIPLTTSQQISILDASASANDLLYNSGYTF